MERVIFFLSLFLHLAGYDMILIPMDTNQQDHLKAYGIAYKTLEEGINIEWLLNFRGGAFLMEEDSKIIELCKLAGVSYELVSSTQVARIYATIEESNMHSLLLEKAPRVAVYIPPYAEPWDDAVTLALEYAQIPYEKIYDDEIIKGKLKEYDWLHLHHEDFTGQYGKFYASYRNASWYQKQVRVNEAIAQKLRFKKVSLLKQQIAEIIRKYVQEGGFLFAMCSAPVTLDIALATPRIDIAGEMYDGDFYDIKANKKLNYNNTLAFQDFQLRLNPLEYEHSDIDITQTAARRGQNSYFTLFDFSAKYDPIPTLLVQNHTGVVKEFLGQDTGFRKSLLKDGITILGEVKGTEEVKYLYSNYGEGFFTFLGGHDPEDYQHMVGDPPTDLRLHLNSPGYRLILNNILFPAAQKKRLKT